MKLTFLFLGLSAAHALAGPITIDVRPALAPNGFGSPSHAAWLANAYTALSTGSRPPGRLAPRATMSNATNPMAAKTW